MARKQAAESEQQTTDLKTETDTAAETSAPEETTNEFTGVKSSGLLDEMDDIDAKTKVLRDRRDAISEELDARLKNKRRKK